MYVIFSCLYEVCAIRMTFVINRLTHDKHKTKNKLHGRYLLIAFGKGWVLQGLIRTYMWATVIIHILLLSCGWLGGGGGLVCHNVLKSYTGWNYYITGWATQADRLQVSDQTKSNGFYPFYRFFFYCCLCCCRCPLFVVFPSMLLFFFL